MSQTQQANGMTQLTGTRKMTKNDERQAIRKMKILFRPMTKLFCPALRLFFCRKLGRKLGACDTQKLLSKLQVYNRRHGLNSQLLRDGKSVTAVRKIIKYAIKGRNSICHSNLPEIKANSKLFLTAWIQVAGLIGAKKTAQKLKRTRKFLSHNTKEFPRTNPEERQRVMASVFRKLELDKNNNWSQIKERAANAIEDALFDVIAEDFAIPMRDFMKKHKLFAYNTILDSYLDSYLQLKIAIAKCSPAHFIAPADGSVFDLGHLKVVMSSRHSAIHEQHVNTLREWPKFFKSLIYVSLGIGAPKAARMISRIYKSLVAARKQARRQIKRARLPPPILRNGQHVSIKGETIRMNRRISTNSQTGAS
ncbi:hypothetical protein DAPPUDRAFT_110389 [Daphnia pulex]|uniref:Uncharacterized protein n=1 Tax=Daphnia pulex TaxID=6669 RepID=E9H661_DAPPU|nr:hypothetical protein DAPPUDRAFT_110389 [Daphnia pulex]|eukprot:EFX72752.1 hypothetical protein DAPPUDRAFT_110389 [Daphnia pulex]